MGGIPVALWFNLRNYGKPGAERRDLGGQFGLLRADDSPKRAFRAFRNYVRNPTASVQVSPPTALRVRKPSILEISSTSRIPRRVEAFLIPAAGSCAPVAPDQARQPGSQRILRARSVPDGSFTSRVMFTPSRAVAERACVYLNGGSGAIQDATGDTLLPLPLPPGTRCRSSVSSIAGVVVDGPSCARTRDTLLTWRREGFQPTTGPPRYDCVASPFDDRGRRSHDCRRTGKPSWRLSLSLTGK